eukprot:g2971.t1
MEKIFVFLFLFLSSQILDARRITSHQKVFPLTVKGVHDNAIDDVIDMITKLSRKVPQKHLRSEETCVVKESNPINFEELMRRFIDGIRSELMETRVENPSEVAKNFARLPRLPVESDGTLNWNMFLTYDPSKCSATKKHELFAGSTFKYAHSKKYYRYDRIAAGKRNDNEVYFCLSNYFSALADHVSSVALFYSALERHKMDDTLFWEEFCRSEWLSKSFRESGECDLIPRNTMEKVNIQFLLETGANTCLEFDKLQEIYDIHWGNEIRKSVDEKLGISSKEIINKSLTVFQSCYISPNDFENELKLQAPDQYHFIEVPRGITPRGARIALSSDGSNIIIETHCRGSECSLYGSALRNVFKEIPPKNIKLAMCNKAGGLVGKRLDLQFSSGQCGYKEMLRPPVVCSNPEMTKEPYEHVQNELRSRAMVLGGEKRMSGYDKVAADVSSLNEDPIVKSYERKFVVHQGRVATVPSTTLQNTDYFHRLKERGFVAIEMEEAWWLDGLYPAQVEVLQWFSDVPISGETLESELSYDSALFQQMNTTIMRHLVWWILRQPNCRCADIKEETVITSHLNYSSVGRNCIKSGCVWLKNQCIDPVE